MNNIIPLVDLICAAYRTRALKMQRTLLIVTANVAIEEKKQRE